MTKGVAGEFKLLIEEDKGGKLVQLPNHMYLEVASDVNCYWDKHLGAL